MFFGKLRAIINTVGKGDPFAPTNAERFSRMAWLMLAAEVLLWPAAFLAGEIADWASKYDDFDLNVGGDAFSLTGILVALVAVHSCPRVPPRRRHARRSRRERVMPPINHDLEGTRIMVKLGDLLYARRMTLTELAERAGLTLANLSILKTGKAKAIRFSTLAAICRDLECQPSDLLAYEAE